MNSDFFVEFESLLEAGNLSKCIELFYLKDNERHLNEFSWDLASLFVTYLDKSANWQNETQRGELYEFIEAANLYLCTNCGNPRELLLVYLESSSDFFFKQDINFIKLVDLIQILLFRVNTRRFVCHSLELSLTQFQKYFVKILADIEPREKNESLETQLRLNLLCGKYVEFIQSFITREIEKSEDDEITPRFKLDLTNGLLYLFSAPFSDVQGVSAFSGLINRIFQLILNLNHDLFSLVLRLEQDLAKREDERAIIVTELAISIFIYHLCLNRWSSPEQISNNKFCYLPQVYSHYYVFRTFLPHTSQLLVNDESEKNVIYLEKGLTTSELLVGRIRDLSLESAELNDDNMSSFIDLLFKISVYSTRELIRKRSGNLLKLIFRKFTRPVRCEFLVNYYNMHLNFSDTANIYIVSFLIYLLKEELNECLNMSDSFYTSSGQFAKLFKLIFHLSNDVKTDLVHESVNINASLNLLRYILLRDKENSTKVYDLVRESSYLSELQRAIQLSKAHYELEIRNLKQDKQAGLSQQQETVLDVCLMGKSNKQLKEPSLEDKLAAARSGLYSIDLIECLRVRVEEIIADKMVAK